MMTKKKFILLTLFLSMIFSFSLVGCGGGGGDDSDEPAASNSTTTTNTTTTTTSTAPEISVLPESFDFGIVTDVNSVEPLEVTIQNNGTANLVVSDITLSDTVNFSLDLNGGTTPCGSSTPTVAADANCTVIIDFDPQDATIPAEGIDYPAVLSVLSNDTTSPQVDIDLAGKRQDITEINVTINQIDACPRSVGEQVKAYVSVTDQGGFPVTTLEAADFALTETLRGASTSYTPSADATFIDRNSANPVTISIALLMDYSYSITQEPDNVTDMENAAISFVSQLGGSDEAEVIKYSTTIERVQSFTSDQTSLSTAIQSTWTDAGGTTALYDAIALAVEDISASAKDRTAIIVITDGEDNDGSGEPLSDSTLEEVVIDAKLEGVPVFTVGLGDRVNPDLLQFIADQTGGTYSASTTSDNLATIYQQLASILFTDQYVLTYNTQLDSTQIGTLQVTATYATGITGSDTIDILTCD
jgi:Ca-activated chloride channel family protein